VRREQVTDPDDIPSAVSCPRCGARWPAEFAHTVPRPACPDCGATGVGIAYSLTLAEEIDIADELTASLRPTDQSRGWQRRWTELQRDLDRLHEPRTVQLSGEAIQGARQELQSFYIQAYHLKDALKLEEPSLASAVESAISSDPMLALLADLANVEKHFQLSNEPRSGDVPSIEVQGTQAGSGKGAWRLEATILHHAKRLDGLEVARAAIESWRRHLTAWDLLSQ
jgi:hypothetical protein